MEQRSLRIASSEKTLFTKLTRTINKILIPTRLGLNSFFISIKRNSLLKSYEYYEKVNEQNMMVEKVEKKYEDSYTQYLEALDKYIMDSIYKKVKANAASDFETNALSSYYEVIHLKQTEYIEYKYRKQKYLLELDYQNMKVEANKVLPRYENFYISKMDKIYKGILKHYSIQLADTLTYKDKNIIYDKIFDLLDGYITEILPIKLRHDEEDTLKNILKNYSKIDQESIEKISLKDEIEKRMILLGISRQLFTHSLPLVVAEQCYIKLLKDLREIIYTTTIDDKREKAYNLLIDLIEDYNVRLLSTKVYWENAEDRENYKIFWKKFQELQNKREENLPEFEKQKQILFIREDIKCLKKAKTDYSKMIDFYKGKLAELGDMRTLKNSYKKLVPNSKNTNQANQGEAEDKNQSNINENNFKKSKKHKKNKKNKKLNFNNGLNAGENNNSDNANKSNNNNNGDNVNAKASNSENSLNNRSDIDVSGESSDKGLKTIKYSGKKAILQKMKNNEKDAIEKEAC